jgi:hypothetical protein
MYLPKGVETPASVQGDPDSLDSASSSFLKSKPSILSKAFLHLMDLKLVTQELLLEEDLSQYTKILIPIQNADLEAIL